MPVQHHSQWPDITLYDENVVTSTEPTFITPNIATAHGFLSVPECAEIITAMSDAPREQAQVVRAGESILDQSLRYCFDHHLPDLTVEQVKQGLGRNLCRCATYTRILSAVLRAAKV